MRVDLVVVVCVAALSLFLPALSTCDPLYVMSAPNLLRVGTPEKVFVEAQDYTGSPLQVRIRVSKFPSNEAIDNKVVTLTQDTNFQNTSEITIPPGTFDRAEKEFVSLTAHFPDHMLQKLVLISFQNGYIFLQTDKTIYTPSSTVYYRIFTLTPDLKPARRTVGVHILNQDGIVISHIESQLAPEGVISQSFNIPELVSYGTWSIVARFIDSQKNFTAEFEVKEYVLPSFEILLTPSKSFYYVDDEEMKIEIKARYLYGKDVSGVGFVIFGVMLNGQRKSLPRSIQRVEIRDGEGSATLKKEHILNVFRTMADLVHSSIYVHVSVMTESGSEMVEAEKRGIMIVSSPYSIHFKRTPRYFKPGMPFDLKVYVSNPYGSAAERIKVAVSAENWKEELETNENGIAEVTMNPQTGLTSLNVKVKTKDPDLTDERQASKNMVASPYQPKHGSQNYLHISSFVTTTSAGKQLKIQISPQTKLVQDHDFTLLILSKGQIIEAKRLKRKGNNLLSENLRVTSEMVPSFRIVVYYHVGSEVVSDSIWVDMDDTCLGKLVVSAEKKNFKPREKLRLKISGHPGARVHLVAVDKGVYVLNNKHRLTQSKISDTIEKLDTACTAGSGRDSMGVFYDAGLVFETNAAGGTAVRADPICETQAKRRRRAVTIMEIQTTVVKNYTGEERQCCVDGMKKNILGYSCERRAEFILDGPGCKAAFLNCCDIMFKHREEEKEQFLQLARSDLSEDEEMDESLEKVTLRSNFPESWLWIDKDLLNRPETSVEAFVPDSITSWKVSAISLSTKGICVADTLDLVVSKDFFIDLKLPYSVARYEQIEIRAILHNNMDEDVNVRVELYSTVGICSAATKTGKTRTTVSVAAKSTYAVPFMIVPLGAPGEYPIEVKAYSIFVRDGIKKDLQVVAGGIRKAVNQKFVLDPSTNGGTQTSEIPALKAGEPLLDNSIRTSITIQGDDLGLTIEKAISGEFLEGLIKQPGGCAEQNMGSTTMPVIAVHYLDNTKQWDIVGFDKRKQAIKFIEQGYNNQLSFRDSTGYFKVYNKERPGTWITAYAAKVFSMASKVISLDEKVICKALQWLITQQSDGIFKDNTTLQYIDSGDVKGKESEASMTAFVLIAMQESYELCSDQVDNLSRSMENAVNYLTSKIDTLGNPYAIAMASYALANAKKPNKSILYRFSHKDGTHWPVGGNHALTIEATAYALLALVKMGEFEKAGPVVKWLNEQRGPLAGYRTTQPTIMAFQALAEYRTQAKTATGKDLGIEINALGRSNSINWSWGKGNAFQTRSEKFPLNANFTIRATGTGKGTLFLEHIYYAAPSEKNVECKKFSLNVSLQKTNKVENHPAIDTYLLVIDVKFMSDRDATNMPVLDVSLPTGFEVETDDLLKLMEGKDRYIQKFEKDKKLSERGSYIIYLTKISHRKPDKIAFRLHQLMNVNFIQPAEVTVYEYYKKDESCVKLYRPELVHHDLTKLCVGDICLCAEGICSTQRKGDQEVEQLVVEACKFHVDYVIKGTVQEIHSSSSTDVVRIEVDTVLKLGTDPQMTEKSVCVFIAHPACSGGMDLQPNKTYLIMGAKQDVHGVKDGYQYVLGEKTWIEYWPTGEEAQERAFANRFKKLEKFALELISNGCRN